jgi:hypothetical protein
MATLLLVEGSVDVGGTLLLLSLLFCCALAFLLVLYIAWGHHVAAVLLICFPAQGYISNLTYMGRRSVLILFINGRPVEQGQLRRAIEAVFTAQNPKANKPWVFLDLKLPPRHVEVNMHPTKKEVGFLHQQDVIDEICR